MSDTSPFSDEQEQLRATVRRFLIEQAPISYVRDMYDDERGTSDAVWKGLADLGLMGILVPEEHGGLGLGLADMGVVIEEMGRALHPGPFFSSAVAATLAVLSLADASDQAALLPDLATGELVATMALFEPGHGYNWWLPSTVAHHGDGGWVLEGVKAYVPDAAAAHLILVSAAGPDGLGLFVVERGVVDITPDPVLDGTRKQASVTLEATPARRIGDGDATAALAGVIDRVVIGMVVDAVGAASVALDTCVQYAKDRVAFDRPIGSFQAIQQLCVEMYKELELARAASYRGLWSAAMADRGELHRVALITKSYASDGLVRLANNSIQIHGGIGTTWEHDIQLYYKRCLSMQAAYGNSFEHSDALAALVIG